MKYYYLLFILYFLSIKINAQDIKSSNDLKYREDQFYTGVTYNFFGNKPEGLFQSGFSLGVKGGFVRDMPINKRRNIAFGIGLGISLNGFNSNVSIIEKEGQYVFGYIDKQSEIYTINRFSINMVELPLEFRWRTSTSTTFKFWRLYTGFKLGYVFNTSSKFKRAFNPIKLYHINAFNRLQYGVYFMGGYNTWNFYVYYALHPIFKDGTRLTNGLDFEVNALQAGLLFFIL